jgi:hypothetical protein
MTLTAAPRSILPGRAGGTMQVTLPKHPTALQAASYRRPY